MENSPVILFALVEALELTEEILNWLDYQREDCELIPLFRIAWDLSRELKDETRLEFSPDGAEPGHALRKLEIGIGRWRKGHQGSKDEFDGLVLEGLGWIIGVLGANYEPARSFSLKLLEKAKKLRPGIGQPRSPQERKVSAWISCALNLALVLVDEVHPLPDQDDHFRKEKGEGG